jgi:two-component system, chemotaxis family, protein-glutamate methylesterase/glutaminase
MSSPGLERKGGMPGADAQARHDLVVIGASAGGVEALRELVACLPGDFPVPIVVVLHLPAGGTSVLPSILDRAGPLRALPVQDGEELEPGTIYVAVPDCHVQIDDGRLDVAGGPRENGHRPAIDPLFRTAAHTHRERTIGVILSGALDDGTLGLRAIKAHGGLTIAQDPQSALHPGMPSSAIRYVAPDRVLPPAQIAAALAQFTDGAREGHNGREMSELDEREQVREQTAGQAGEETGLTCPDCGGAIYEQRDGTMVTFRCRVGHQYGSDTFAIEQSKTVENSLWAALRLLEERAVLMRRLAERHEAQERTARQFIRKAEELEDHAAQLTQLLREITGSPQPVSEV